MANNDFLYVQDNEQLCRVCEQLAQAPVLAVDTEFTREKTYYPQLGLIQVASDSLVACIDPLAMTDLTPLVAIFRQPTITKILHAARQDLEVLSQSLQVIPEPLFDSQLAACFLGLHDQISYAALVQRYLHVTLPKAHTRTDWSQRPLSNAQLQYAADDVRYLLAVYPHLSDALQAQGRLAWCESECAQLTKMASAVMNTEDLWQHVSGIQRLVPAQLAILRELAIWREQRAQQSNRPRRWILQDELLIVLATQAPTSLQQLREIVALPAAVVERHATILLELITKGKNLPASQWPQPPSRELLTPEQKSLLTALSAKLRDIAEQQHICVPVLATRRELERLVVKGQSIPLMHGWRYELAGQYVSGLLSATLTT